MSNTDKIAILIDSGTDVPPELVQKYHMFVAPLKIIFRDGEYADGIDLTAAELYQRLPLEIPKTSLPSAETVLQILDQIRSEGYNKVLTVTISSGLSGTNNMLKLLAANIKDLDMYVYCLLYTSNAKQRLVLSFMGILAPLQPTEGAVRRIFYIVIGGRIRVALVKSHDDISSQRIFNFHYLFRCK